ncbi:hypothetical protein K523DRAFT_94397 [Schizophyllum commune Tattone D]|nr:hypothetical protein K523DRAFT_94397 [Schizophyllum commune Tattone D]
MGGRARYPSSAHSQIDAGRAMTGGRASTASRCLDASHRCLDVQPQCSGFVAHTDICPRRRVDSAQAGAMGEFFAGWVDREGEIGDVCDGDWRRTRMGAQRVTHRRRERGLEAGPTADWRSDIEGECCPVSIADGYPPCSEQNVPCPMLGISRAPQALLAPRLSAGARLNTLAGGGRDGVTCRMEGVTCGRGSRVRWGRRLSTPSRWVWWRLAGRHALWAPITPWWTS